MEKEKEEQKETLVESGWSKEEIALLTKGIVKFPPGTKDRWTTIADFVATKSQKEVIKKAQEIAQKREKDAADRKEKETQQKEKTLLLQKQTIQKLAEAPTPVAAAKPVPEETTEAVSGWTAEQQKQMELGMKQVPATVATKERWI